MPILGIYASSTSPLVYGNSFQSISTITVGAGGAASVTFSSIPNTYKHLQIRAIMQTNRGTYNIDPFNFQVGNGSIDTGSNYAYHQMQGAVDVAYSNVTAAAGSSSTFIAGGIAATGVSTSVFGTAIIDFLDYANTSKYKTTRALSSTAPNSTASGYSGAPYFNSGLWMSTSAIDTIKIVPVSGTQFNQYTQFALYGIKGA